MASACPILDEAHLARQTFGDADLEREVLALFAGQIDAMVLRITQTSGAERDALLHHLKGSARAVGAMALGQMAEDLEGTESRGDGADALQALLAATLRTLRLRLA